MQFTSIIFDIIIMILFVQSNNRSSGTGKKLIEKSLEYVKENNARYVCL